MEPWNTIALSGELVSINGIHAAHVEAAGREISLSATYRMLRRHGWRKVKPDARHPKSDLAAQEEFKKNSKIFCGCRP
ncbi:MAG: winged helix-turn-helix domain-containing protein [Deltaproteobacteria bacterium]|nr:winged helix-turn-helix domain-containing protein [Deltaproteobacteria bacterium]